MIQQTYTLPGVVRGDQWPGVASLTITINGSPPAGALASVKIQFRSRAGGQGAALAELSTDDGSIVITDADTWSISMPAQALPLAAGRHVYDMQTRQDRGQCNWSRYDVPGGQFY